MRAPADSTNPSTGTRARSAMRSTSTTVSACASPSEPPANDGVLRVAVRPARPSTRACAASTPSPGAGALAHAARAHLRAQRLQRAGVAQHLQALERRQALVEALDERERHVASRHSTALWPPKPNELEIASAGRPSATRAAARVPGT